MKVVVPVLLTGPGMVKDMLVFEQSVKEHAVEIERLLDVRDKLRKLLTEFDY